MKKVLPFTLTLVFLCITTINLFAQDLTIVGATGYTQDVVANGVGSMMSSTTTTADYNNYCFLSQDWKLNSGDAPIGVGLPAGGVIVSPDINGLTYQIPSAATPYGVNNSLRLNNYPSDL